MHARPMVYAHIVLQLALLVLAACATDEAKDGNAAGAPAEPPASAPKVPPEADLAARGKVTPTFGGSVLWVGDYQAELAVHEDGLVEGLVFAADAKELPHDRVSGFSAVLALESGARLTSNPSWDANVGRFRGRADLTSEIVIRPIDVKIEVDGKAQSGVLEEYVLLPSLDMHAEAKASADTKAAHDAKRLVDAKIDAKLAEPSAKSAVNGQVKAGAKAVAKANARAKAKASAKARLDAPAPKVSATAKTSAATEPKKSGGSASVKAKASFGLGQ